MIPPPVYEDLQEIAMKVVETGETWTLFASRLLMAPYGIKITIERIPKDKA